jgi:hypothetical protein
MSRRHNSSRRRNYGRRQHEVRERRPSPIERTDWPGPNTDRDWHVGELDEERPPARAGDGFGASNP